LEPRRLLTAIYVSTSNGNLYTVDTGSGAATLLGNMGTGVDQIANSTSLLTNMYATDGDLYEINQTTAAATDIGPVGVNVTSLGMDTSGDIYGATTSLYSLNPTTGAGAFVGNLNLPDQVDPNTNNVYADTISEDLSFGVDGRLYLTAHIHDETAGDQFFSVNTSTGAATKIGDTGFTDVVGLALGQDNVMYGVTTSGNVISINTSTGVGTLATTISGITGTITDAASFIQQTGPTSTAPAVSFTSTNFTTNLNSSDAVVTVQVTGHSPSSAFSVSYNTIDGTAIAGTDYVAESGSLTFPIGATSEQILIPILNSQTLGGNKSFDIELTDPYTDQGTGSGSTPPYVLVSPDTAEVTIQNVNSAFEISPGTVSVNSSQGSATVVVQRLGVTSDEETVDFSTVYQTTSTIGAQAIPGTDYSTVLTTLTFQPGQTSQAVTIPVLNNPDTTVGTSENVLLQLSNAQIVPPTTGSATAQNLFFLGAANSSLASGTGLLTINNVNSIAPTVQSITLNHVGKRITSLTVLFNKPVSQASAEALSSYGLFSRNHDGPYATGPRSPIKLKTASYDASGDSVTITPRKSLAENKVYQFVAYASDGVTDTSGNALQGNGDTTSSNYSAFFGLGNHLNYVDADGDKITLKLSGPGLLDLRRAFDGDASSLILDDTTPDSVLSGKVVKGKYGDGLATIDLVGPTGGVNDELTKPPFIIVMLD
jgi:hypothetical protein